MLVRVKAKMARSQFIGIWWIKHLATRTSRLRIFDTTTMNAWKWTLWWKANASPANKIVTRFIAANPKSDKVALNSVERDWKILNIFPYAFGTQFSLTYLSPDESSLGDHISSAVSIVFHQPQSTKLNSVYLLYRNNHFSYSHGIVLPTAKAQCNAISFVNLYSFIAFDSRRSHFTARVLISSNRSWLFLAWQVHGTKNTDYFISQCFQNEWLYPWKPSIANRVIRNVRFTQRT